ncbi:MAG: hypothetical protein WCA35_10515 [Kovacikia sp.]
MFTFLSASLLLNRSGDVFDLLGEFVLIVIFGAAVVGVIRLIVGLVKASKSPPVPSIRGVISQDDDYYGTIYGDGVEYSDWGWHNSGSHSSGDLSTSDSAGVCDTGGFDGGGCDHNSQ